MFTVLCPYCVLFVNTKADHGLCVCGVNWYVLFGSDFEVDREFYFKISRLMTAEDGVSEVIVIVPAGESLEKRCVAFYRPGESPDLYEPSPRLIEAGREHYEGSLVLRYGWVWGGPVIYSWNM